MQACLLVTGTTDSFVDGRRSNPAPYVGPVHCFVGAELELWVLRGRWTYVSFLVMQEVSLFLFWRTWLSLFQNVGCSQLAHENLSDLPSQAMRVQQK